ncbi:hypothetical protein Tco_0675829, partial [Tanacetum coccineum]
ESVETLCEIVEEARVEKPLDSALASVCLYTKQSQELLEYVIGTCPKDFNKRDKRLDTTPLTRKKVRVKGATVASGSKPRRNTKKDMTLPAKSDKQKVEDHPRINKSIVIRKNRVDSSISYKLWQATGKLFANVDYQWKPTRRKFTLGERCPLTRITKSKVVPIRQPKTDSTSNIVITERLRNTSQKALTRYQHKNKQEKATSTDIPTIAETQTTDSSVIYTVVSANQ